MCLSLLLFLDPNAVKQSALAKIELEQQKKENVDKEEEEATNVAVPSMNDDDIADFFATKEISEIKDKVDVKVDDFDNIFIEANDMWVNLAWFL